MRGRVTLRLHLHRPECPSAAPCATDTKHRADATLGERSKCYLNVAVSADIENDELLPLPITMRPDDFGEFIADEPKGAAS